MEEQKQIALAAVGIVLLGSRAFWLVAEGSRRHRKEWEPEGWFDMLCMFCGLPAFLILAAVFVWIFDLYSVGP